MRSNHKYLPFYSREMAVAGFLAFAAFLLHLAFNGRYGYFIDEYYYMACTEHPALGYVDQPPLSIAILAFWRGLFGDSLFALRFLPAVAGAFTVYLAGLLVREFKGGRFAQAVACIAVIINPLFLYFRNYYSMNVYDVLFWTLAAFLVVRIIRNERPKSWIVLGVVLGLGLLNKIDVLWLGAGIFLGLLFTQQRKSLLTPWPYIAAAIALLLFLPHIIWQIQNGWPTLEFIHNARAFKYQGISRLDFLLSLALEFHPLVLPVWIAGLVSLFSGSLKRFRLIGIIWLTAFAILFISGRSKAEYLSPALPMILAAGGIAFENFALRKRWRVFKPAIIILLITGGAITAPLTLPVLPVESLIVYMRTLGMQPPSAESKELAELPQHFADQFGFENMAETTARVYHLLPRVDRGDCVIIASHYGFAAAIDFYRATLDMPKAVCSHNSYWMWGPGDKPGKVAVAVGLSEKTMRRFYQSVTAMDTVCSRFAMPYENNVPVFVCREPLSTLQAVWPTVKNFE
ncbi:phospholipid carrier-dependent glycosyltransferase [candidate division KSB1 bacterium]|nr:MAG: phospholipid carrier-dependent glycosyltransferase [candidate division KSB1 bacterium]